jgi:membrane associated rhomboid family serine protease
MDNFINQLIQTFNLMQQNAVPAFYIICIFWLIFILDVLLKHRLTRLGIYPRHILGLPGILFNTFLHGNFEHLFFNSIPLFVLIDFVLMEGWHQFLIISAFIIIVGGFLLWLFGRRGIHVGASSLISGYFGYLITNAYRHPSISAIVLAIICIYYFGGILLGLFPQEDKTSWEGHVFGFLSGIASALLF